MPALGHELIEHDSGKLRIWDEPLPGKRYVIGIDGAENRVRDRNLTRGKTNFGHDWPDFSAAVVIELEDALHVATWHGHIDPFDFAFACAALGVYYNSALLVPEMNSVGTAIIEALVRVIGYSPLYRNRLYNRIDVDPLGSEFGFRTNENTRELLLSRIRTQISGGQLFTRDPILLREMRTMEYDEAGKARGRGRNKDDLVMALGLALIGRSDELNHGTEDKPLYNSRLSQDDQITYDRIHQQLARLKHARNLARSRVRGGPVVRSLPRGPL